MGSKKSNGSRKDPLNTPKVWEKARREKMKIFFNELEEVLPFYDPATPMSRLEILKKSKMYIKDLQEQNQDLLNGGFDEVYKTKMTNLKQRVKELLKRVDQLTDLLRTANIMIPPLEAYPNGLNNSSSCRWINQRPKKWTEKINLVVPDENIKSVLTLIKDYKKNSTKVNMKKKQTAKTSEKPENNVSNEGCLEKSVTRKKRSLKKSKSNKVINSNSEETDNNFKKDGSDTGSQSPSQFKENQPVDFNMLSSSDVVVSRSSSDSDQNSSVPSNESSNAVENSTSSLSLGTAVKPPPPPPVSISKVTIPQKIIETPQNIILPSASNMLQSNTFILTNDGSLVQLPILNSTGTMFGANSNILTQTAIVKPNTGLLTPLVINKPSPVLVLQKSPSQIIQTAQIINPAPQVVNVSQPSVQILGGSVVYTVSSPITSAKVLPHILSKAPANKKKITRDSTVTTYVNKIPIPALSKQSYVKKSAPVNSKDKSTISKTKDASEKQPETENESVNEVETGEEEERENCRSQNKKANAAEIVERGKDTNTEEESVSNGLQKRSSSEENVENRKKQKLNETTMDISDSNVFKPIENPMTADGIFCNLSLPNSVNPSLSVSPTAAFLSSFPIVAATRSEAEDEAERKTDDEKDPKQNNHSSSSVEESNKSNSMKEGNTLNMPKECSELGSTTDNPLPPQGDIIKEKISEPCESQMEIQPSNTTVSNNTLENTNDNTNNNKNHDATQQQHLDSTKSWDQFQQENCEIRSDVFYLPPHNNNININDSVGSLDTANASIISYSGIISGDPSYKTYAQNNSVNANNTNNNGNIQNPLNELPNPKNNHFEYTQKDNYVNKISNYGNVKKACSNNVGETYNVVKTQATTYQIESTPTYQLIPAKEVPNQRNARTVNWMTEPEVRNRGLVYGSQSDKITSGKAPIYTQSDNFYINNQNSGKVSADCSAQFMMTDQNKMNYQKNDFYGKDQRCKSMDKRVDPKCYTKTPQNTYNIFDYNYSANYYGEDDTSKYCNNVQTSYPGKTKKNIIQSKKKSDEVHHVANDHQANDPSKRATDQIITNIDFNPVPANQECFTWVPGKNVEWLPSKSFGLDTNLVVPSTLPTLVGDLALGTNSTNEMNPGKTINPKLSCQSTNIKPNSNDISKDYVDLGMGNNSGMLKAMDTVDTNKQYLEPFANLSKNIFDVTPTNVHHSQTMAKNDFDKMNFVGNNNNETIVLKNIFELPVSKNSGSEFTRNKHRPMNNSQNTFLSVSQLVEPPIFEGSNMKNDGQMESSAKTDQFSQNYPNYNNNNNNSNNQKTYKSKTRSSHCKYNDRKYHGYKNGSSSYTAEALIRSNSNVNYQPNEFGTTDLNTNFFNGKPNQKPEQFLSNNKIDFEINMKSDFGSGTNQNIYSDFNFSSPVPNFTIGSTVGTDFTSHDTSNNFSTQNNSFFSDFITPEYPLTENVSNSLLLPPCTIALQNPFVIDKRNGSNEKTKTNTKQYMSNSRSRKQYECSKTSYNDFSISPTSTIFTTSSITCPTIFTTSACQNLLPVPTQSIPISFSSPSFTSSNISFPPLSSSTSNNYHRFTNPSQNSSSGSFLPSNTMFTTCASKPLSTSHNSCYTSNPLTNVTNSVITSSFPVGNVPFSTSSQSSIPFFSLSNPIIPSSAPTSTSNSLANFNLSTIFPEINQKGNYHYS